MRRFFALMFVLAPLAVGCSSHRFHCDLLPPGLDSAAAESIPPLVCPPTNPEFRPTNLVFQGGGVKGIAYVGALEVLEEQGILEGVERVAGTSAGAITATLVAVGYQPSEIRAMMLALEFSKFEDGGASGIFRIFQRYGYFKGDYFLDWMRCAIERKTGKSPTTFEYLGSRKDEFHELRLFTTDVNTGSTQELSAQETPDLEVALAARMSMSIPLFFASIEHAAFPPNGPGERHVFVDGGVLFNYPITAFDGDRLNLQTLGFVLLDTEDSAPPQSIDSLLSYSRALVEADLNVQVDDLEFDRPNLVRTVVVDDLGVPTTDFKIGKQGKLALTESGRNCTCRYLTDRPRSPDRIAAVQSPALLGEPVPTANFDHCGWVLDPPADATP